MWLLQETSKFFAKCFSFYLRPFWGNFNPRNIRLGENFHFLQVWVKVTESAKMVFQKGS